MLAGAALRPCFGLGFLVQNCSNFDQIFDSRICSNFDSNLDPNCSEFDPYFDLSLIKIARNSIQIPLPKSVRISSAQNCSNFGQNCLNFDGESTSGARWARFRSSLGTSWVPWGAPAGSRDRFWLPWRLAMHQNWLKFDRSSAPILIPEFRSQVSTRCAWGRIPVFADRCGTQSMFQVRNSCSKLLEFRSKV